MSSLTVDYLFIDKKLFGFGDSFWGALIGAAITGIFAISVYILGKWQEVKKAESLINSSIWVLSHVNESIINKLDLFFEEAESKKDMSTEVRESIPDIIAYKSFIKQINFQHLFSDTNVLKYSTHYITAFEEFIEILEAGKEFPYGYLFLDLEECKKPYLKMKESIKKL